MNTPERLSGHLEYRCVLKLLEIKDSDIRIMTLEQGRDAADKGIHIGGAMSATVPLVSIYYGGIIRADVVDPTRPGQDLFVLSKGHAVATLASVYADLGYFDRTLLKNSRSMDSILNGHPGPLLPGVHIPTGPMGQGMPVAGGFALAGKDSPNFDVFALTGDGELQEGTIWEAVMYSAARRLDNLCVLVDKNEGQLDDPTKTAFPMPNVDGWFESFGYRVFDVDGTQYEPVWRALREFKYGSRDGRPTAIVCRNNKGAGGLSRSMISHKVVLPDELAEQELALQKDRRDRRVREFLDMFERLSREPDGAAGQTRLIETAGNMNLEVTGNTGPAAVRPVQTPARTQSAAPRDKKIRYEARRLPVLDRGGEYAASSVVTMCMGVFAADRRVASVDADLGSTSGLQGGVGQVDRERAHNTGVAEANMMCIGEAYAVLGYNTWVSTFCPFFNFNVLRRIAINQQERLETIAGKDGWLTEGHGLDLTFLATAPNFETKTNGATHMGNDDIEIFKGIAHLKIIDVSCPYQLMGILKWIMEGNKGLVYVRIMRSPSRVIYDRDFVFDYGRGYVLKEGPENEAVLISSGRGVHEILAAAAALEQEGINTCVVDMPSIDESLLLQLYDTGRPVIVAEQNNGYIFSEYQRLLFRRGKTIDPSRLKAVNTLDVRGRPQFIHSATYAQLIEKFGLAPPQLAKTVTALLGR
jgi:transketolase